MENTQEFISHSEMDEHISPTLQLPVTVDTLLKDVRQASDAQLSPDGQRVAFVLSEWLPEQSRQRSRIWIVRTDGSEPEPVSRGSKRDFCPRWSPDSKQLAFISIEEGEKGKAQIYIVAVHGSEAQRLCSMPNGVSSIDWSPDGRRIAFLSQEWEEPQSDPKVFTPEQARHKRLWTIRSAYDTPEPVTPDGLTVWEYAWSPDSQQIAIYYTPGSEETDWYRGQIGIVPADGGAVRQVTRLTRQAGSLTWSPDGTRLAYTSGEWSDPGIGGGDIYMLSLADGSIRNLTPGIECSPSWCGWLSDGQHLLYVAWHGVLCQIGTISLADGKITVLTEHFDIGERFRPRLSPDADMQHFAVTHSEQHPPDIWLGTLQSSKNIVWKRLTHLNALLEETLSLVPTERISYESVDGWRIDALLTLPRQRPDNTAPPLIVNVHGGPSGVWTDDWDFYRSQLLAQAGYAVLRPNIRGSMGRGVAFADAVLGDMGGKDFQDILRGVDYLAERGIVDGERVGIMGWSYGGFMSAWAVTQTNRFKAAIMGAGVCDFHSFHAQSNIPDWDMRFLSKEIVNPLDHPDIYRKFSAITYAGRVTTPTLIVHGENDQCVPVNQAYAFYRALRERKVPTELVVYPREGHGLSEREHMRDYQQRMLRWFKTYL